MMVFSMFGCQAINAPAGGAITGADKKVVVPAASAGDKAVEPSQSMIPSGTYTVSLDVNPSIELTVENGVVTKIAAYNDDAKQLLLTVDVSGLAADEAMKKIVEALAAEGYINNTEIKPYLIISVYDAQQAAGGLTENLKDVAADTLDTLDIKCNVASTVIASDIPAKAEALGISSGRYMIFDYIAKKEGTTIEEAIAKYGTLKISELLRLYDCMEAMFDNDDEDGKDETDVSSQLSADQQAVVDAAYSKYLAGVKAAEETFVAAKKTAINDLKTKWEELKPQYKGKMDSPEFKQAKKALLANYKATRHQIKDAFRQAVQKA